MPTKRKCDQSGENANNKIRNRIILYSDDESDSSIEGINATDNEMEPIPSTSAIQEPLTQTLLELPSASHIIDESTEVQELHPELDSEILALLGDAPKSDIKFGKATHKDLACRWQDILEKGLPKQLKDKLMEEYLIPENCDMLMAPLLNPEIKIALADNMVKRDLTLLMKQKQLSVAIAALNKSIELIISKESHTEILKPVIDACRLLCDSHCVDTRTRRGFVISSINSDMKETLIDSKRSNLLFGNNISERLKSAKSIQKSASDLKQTRTNKSLIINKNNFIKQNRSSNNRLNWKTMPRKITPKAESTRTRQGQRRILSSTGSQLRDLRETAGRTTRGSRIQATGTI